MTKRYIYLLLSTLTLITLFTIGIFIPGTNIFGGISMGFLFYLIVLVIALFTNLIRMESFGKHNDNVISLIFPLGLFTIRYKKLYYSDLGYFYARLHRGKVHVHNQHYLFCEKLFEVYYDDNFENLSEEIKYQLQQIFADELKEIDKSKKFKSWNGYLDKQSQREGKIDQII